MNTPLWARKIIVLLTMLSVIGVMYLALPPEGKQEFGIIFSQGAIPVFVVVALMGIFIVLGRWADGEL